MIKKYKKGLWDSPIYRFRIPEEDYGSYKYREIIFDVTGSAPSFEEVKDTMDDVFQKLLSSEEGEKIKKVIDFGAAKLRVTLYLLKNKKQVAAVEFEEINKNSGQAKRIWKKCKNYKELFKDWIFPFPFISHKETYDLALLINVLPIMPVFAERLLVLQLLYNKITEKGYIFWYAQKEGSYKDRRISNKFNIGDGIWTGDKKYYKMFFRYHSISEVDEMMLLNGFEFVKQFTAPGNDARLYKKNKYNLLKGIITPERILKSIPHDETIKEPSSTNPKVFSSKKELKEVTPTPPGLSIEKIYEDILNSIPSGKKDSNAPEKYHRAASVIISRLFRNDLTDMEIKQDMDKGKKVLDTVFRNNAERGFFKDLSEKFNIKCPYIIVEAKNYKYDPSNNEFDQLAGRLKDNIGKFGILVCRKIDNQKVVQERCESYLDDGKKYVIVLTDEDLLELISLAKEDGQEGINSLMHKKIRPLIFKSK